MAEFLAVQIRLGRITVHDVPEVYKDRAKELLGIEDMVDTLGNNDEE